MRALALSLVLALVPAAVAAQPEPAAAPPAVAAMLETLAASADQPSAYEASVALHVRLRVFPFIRMTLHGTSMFKRPGLYRFVFRGVPVVAKAFSDMKYDLGDPARWPERYAVTLAPQSTAQRPVLRLTPKTPVLVKALDVTIDPERGHILHAVWSRNDGGTIALTQTFAAGPAGRAVVTRQDATIDLPRMKASLAAEYADFRTDTTLATFENR